MLQYRELLSPFPFDRKTMLDEILRWSVAPTFFHRSSVLLHSERVGVMVGDLALLAVKCLPGYDSKKAWVIAHVHDDIEIRTGDKQACHKAMMTEKQKKKLDKKERIAIRDLGKLFPGHIEGYNYREILACAHLKLCPESQMVKYCDKLDSYCEALHEVLAGNNLPLPMLLQDTLFLHRFAEKYPLIKPVLENGNHPLTDISLRITKALGGRCGPHTKKSVKKKSNFPFYDHWKRLIVRHLGKKGMDYLINQKESFCKV